MSIIDPSLYNDGTGPDDDEPRAPVVRNAPHTIWLNVGEPEFDCEFDDLSTDFDAVTWCDSKQFDADIQYIRADLVAAAMPVNWMDDPEWVTLAKALGRAIGLPVPT